MLTRKTFIVILIEITPKKKLSEEENSSCEGPLTLDECTRRSLNSMHLHKSPGSDRHSTEFYNYIWNKIAVLVTFFQPCIS